MSERIPDRWEWGHRGRPCPARPPEDAGGRRQAVEEAIQRARRDLPWRQAVAEAKQRPSTLLEDGERDE